MALLRLDKRVEEVEIRAGVGAAVGAVLVLVLVKGPPEGAGTGVAGRLLGGAEGGEVVQGAVNQVEGAGGDNKPLISLPEVLSLCHSYYLPINSLAHAA